MATWADAMAAVVMIIRAFSWNNCALVCGSAPGGSSLQSNILTAIIVGIITRRNNNTSVGLGTPTIAIVANASTTSIVAVRALNRNVSASAGQLTPGSTSNQSDASTTRVVGSATAGNDNASPCERTPRLSSRANADAAVVMVVGAFNGNGLTAVSD